MIASHSSRRHGSGRAASGSRYPDNRGRIAQARQAAEALFTPKSPRVAPSNSLPVLGDGPSPDPQHSEEVANTATVPERTTALPIDPPPPSAGSTIPASQVAQIRTWVKYGMTIPQVAEVFEVPVGEVERVLHKVGRG